MKFFKVTKKYFYKVDKKKSLMDIEKFNKLPEYKLQKSINISADNSMVNDPTTADLLTRFNKKKNEIELDKLEIAKHILNTQRQQLLNRAKNEYRSGSIEQGVNMTKNLLNNRTQFKQNIRHPELEKRTNYEELRETSLTQNYGDYSKYFSVKKESNVIAYDDIDSKVNSMSTSKKFENLKRKYSSDIHHKRYLAYQDKVIADQIKKDLESYSIDDKNLSNLLSKTYSEVKKDKYWDEFISNINNNLDKKKTLEEYNSNPIFYNFFNKGAIPDLEKKFEIKKSKFSKSTTTDDPNVVDGEFNDNLEINKDKRKIDDIAMLEIDNIEKNLFSKRAVLSYPVQEEMYQLYLKGVPLPNLCLKYGVIGLTAKNIICNRHVYWTFIFPKIGPLKHRQLLEELKNSKQYDFVDYGSELDKLVSENKNSDHNRIKLKNTKEEVPQGIRMDVIRKKTFRIPIEYVGNRNRGFLLKEIFKIYGKGARDVNNDFKGYFTRNKRSGFVGTNVHFKAFLGPRIASLKKF